MLAEFGLELRVTLATLSGQQVEMSLGELLPRAFVPESLVR